MNRLQSICLSCVLGTPLLLSDRLFAQTIEIGDGGTALLEPGSYALTFTTTTASDASTALLETVGAVSLLGAFDAYYGEIRPNDGSTLSFNPSGSVNPANVAIGGADYTSATTFLKQGGAYSLAGTDASAHSMHLMPYGVLDLTDSSNTGDLTLSKSLYISSYSDVNAGYIKFKLALTGGVDSTKKIVVTDGNIVTDETSGAIDVSKNIQIDMASISTAGITPGTQTFTVATGTSDFACTGTPNVTGNSDGLWNSIFVLANAGGQKNLKVQAAFSPSFLTDGGSYVGSFAQLLSAATENTTQTLEKDVTLSSTTTMTKNLTIALGTYHLTTSSYSLVIAAGKTLSLSSSGGGVFGGNVCFSDTTSTLRVCSSAVLSSSFTTSQSASSGIIEIGDGTTTVAQTLTTSQIVKVNKIVVKSNATLTLATSS